MADFALPQTMTALQKDVWEELQMVLGSGNPGKQGNLFDTCTSLIHLDSQIFAISSLPKPAAKYHSRSRIPSIPQPIWSVLCLGGRGVGSCRIRQLLGWPSGSSRSRMSNPGLGQLDMASSRVSSKNSILEIPEVALSNPGTFFEWLNI